MVVKSTKPGIAEITVTGGQAYVCDRSKDADYQCLGDDCEKVYKYWDCHYTDKKDLNPKQIQVEFLEVANNEVYLTDEKNGWNFVSVPFALSGSPTINTLLGSAMCEDGITPVLANFLKWNAGSQNWTYNDMSTVMTPLNGYWMQVNCPYVLELNYVAAGAVTPPQKTVSKGWNTVGLSWDSPIVTEYGLISIDKAYTSFLDWVEALQKYGFPVANTGEVCGETSSPFTTCGANMEPKQGYWIWVTDATDLQGWSA
jgi:hypothetical protein